MALKGNFTVSFPELEQFDKIIAGLKEDSGLRAELASLRSRLEQRLNELAAVKAELEKLSPKDGLRPETIEVLRILFNEAKEITSGTIASKAGLSKGLVDYHLGVLVQRDYAFIGLREIAGLNNTIDYYGISQNGRAFLVSQGLV